MQLQYQSRFPREAIGSYNFEFEKKTKSLFEINGRNWLEEFDDGTVLYVLITDDEFFFASNKKFKQIIEAPNNNLSIEF